jgi:hypothetical protein
VAFGAVAAGLALCAELARKPNFERPQIIPPRHLEEYVAAEMLAGVLVLSAGLQ